MAGCYIINIIYKIPDLYITAEYNSSYMMEDMRSLSLTKEALARLQALILWYLHYEGRGMGMGGGGQTLLLASADSQAHAQFD